MRSSINKRDDKNLKKINLKIKMRNLRRLILLGNIKRSQIKQTLLLKKDLKYYIRFKKRIGKNYLIDAN